MADELGYVGEERAAFVGDIMPVPKPKSVEAPKTATQPTTTKAAPTATKPKEPAKVAAFVDEPWPEYGPPAPMKMATRPEGVGPRVAVGMTPAPSRDVSALLGQQGTARLMAVEQGLANAASGIDTMLDPEFKNRVALSQVRVTGAPVNPMLEAEARKEQERVASRPAPAPKPTPAPQPMAAPKPAPAPAATPKDVAVGGTTFQQAYDGLILAGVPKAVIDERVNRGDPDAQRAVIEMYEKYAR
jgi:hypothetical protein